MAHFKYFDCLSSTLKFYHYYLRRRTTNVTVGLDINKVGINAALSYDMNDPFVSCPYNYNHRVPRSRLQGHVVKCQAKYPELHICPYNATHRVPESEMQSHLVTCPSKDAILPEDRKPRVLGILTTPKPTLQNDRLPETDPNHEMWDD